MYRLGSRMLIIVSCVMAMVRALPVNTEMVIWILTGVIICEGIDAGIVENIAKRTKNRILEKINNVNMQLLVLSVYKVQNRLLLSLPGNKI